MSFEQSKTIGTSLKQVPAQVKIINWEGHKKDMVLDYGAGKYPNLVQEHLKSQGVSWVESFDPYNPDISDFKDGLFEVVICSNVLNVIKDDVMLHDTVSDIAKHLYWEGTAYIQIYFGDKSGEAGETTRGYQRNAVMKHYMKFLSPYFEEITANANRFVCKKPIPQEDL